MALTLAVGFVVDDAIVMLENIVRHMELGKSPMEAAFAGSREVAFTILSMTVSLAAVFIPVLFMGGIVGRLMHEFAVTIAAAILVSGVVSVTLTPMLCSRFLKPPHETAHGADVPGHRAGVRSGARRLRLDAAADAALPPGGDGDLRWRSSSAPYVLFTQGADRVHPERGHRPDPGADRGRRRASASRRCGSTSTKPPRSWPPIRTSPRSRA